MRRRKLYRRQLNPVGPHRRARRQELERRRKAENASAFVFLTSGDGGGNHTPPPYGSKWDRDYNPMPYPEALPVDLEMYSGTGVGLFYGRWNMSGHDYDRFYASLAGWNITRRGAEVRARRT